MPRIDLRLPRGLHRRAATALEFAVILPVLLTLVLGCVDFGRFAHTYIVVTNAARAGASFATVNPYTAETYSLWKDCVRDAVEQEMTGLNRFDAEELAVLTTVIAGTAPQWDAQVEVSYPFQTLIDWPGLPNSIELRQSVVMRTIRP